MLMAYFSSAFEFESSSPRADFLGKREHMPMKETMKHIKRSLRVLGGLAVVVGVSSVLGSNNVRSEALKGFSSAATGGRGGEVVQVRSTKALKYELCRSYSFGTAMTIVRARSR
ncbi:hypothetical protein [Bradyrhizobium sp. 170]|uniref:hypothetical protein n=1 Tax=Bradyrhizobium sp. 170 TaxID=2782641 RepID=UPI001FFF8CCC|nr:hypothetical protein [Bradyrhizobium sp. 170]UPK05638.1 hypothetical protein IVB05_08415 [Bradyrhizobium sp. 170]